MASNSAALPKRPGRKFYTWVAVGLILIVFSGFAKTYYLKGLFGSPTLPTLVHLHGFIMTSWFLLFLVQVRLVDIRRVQLHRKLGVFGFMLAALIVVVGLATAIAAARRGATPGPPPLSFLAVPVFDMVVFATIVTLGLIFRRKTENHRRLMVLASTGILAAAIARIPVDAITNGGPLAFFGLTDLCVLVVLGYDTVKHKRLHPVYGWGLLFIVLSQVFRLAISGTSTWLAIAKWMVG